MDQEEHSKFDVGEQPVADGPDQEQAPAEPEDTNEPITQEEFLEAEAYSEQAAAAANVGKGTNWWQEIYEWVQAIAVAIVLALLINQFLFSIVQVQGSSMVPTLHDRERLIVSKLLYQPKDRDIVVIKSSVLGKYIIKRVIAVSGQTVDLNPRTGDVTVDGVVLDEPYIKEKLHSLHDKLTFPLTVDEDFIFVMGDNRNNSTDSRMIGVIPKSEVVGKAVFRFWPLGKFGGLYKTEQIAGQEDQ